MMIKTQSLKAYHLKKYHFLIRSDTVDSSFVVLALQVCYKYGDKTDKANNRNNKVKTAEIKKSLTPHQNECKTR